MSKANIEALKEVLRWTVLFVGSFIISELIRQADLIPESWLVKVFVFTFAIPIRTIFIFGLTMVGRYVDKYLHEAKKEEKTYPVGFTPPGGLLPF